MRPSWSPFTSLRKKCNILPKAIHRLLPTYSGKVLSSMTTGSSQGFVRKSLQLADQMLTDARLMLQNGRLKSAADRAYYAMFHAARAAVSQEVPRLPKSHKAVRTLFAKHFIATQRTDRALSRDLTFAFELRQASSYEVEADVGEDVVQQVIDKAEAFVAAVKKLVANGGGLTGSR